ncbi:forespore capture DNA-binding protein RefZ [Cytobacillus sp. IB215316]|uniref:forespore capture DNA-binding protein RefZ n=1 Tax=Cytobacillus sp. IB215316 TaxID=3097354 RepID=UPI002A106B1F|nr:forespore capture DNA-binding protein RefZ [Cytobacillus sp. IB215316]MDX8359274.1 forespore capture DNA-binding protein RefZ [Cytobacillus sp. IB215316]
MTTTMKTKQKIINAAIELFNVNGYTGTSVRDIANRAKVNVANISYYFVSKEGLLEYLVSNFFEGYFLVIENVLRSSEKTSAKETLKQFVLETLIYQKQHHLLTRFVCREITLETTLIREVMTTYLTKEKYYLIALFEKGIKDGEFRDISIPYTIIQLKGFLSTPYLQSQYISEVLHIIPTEEYFLNQYMKQIEVWLEGMVYMPITEERSLTAI